MVPPKEFKFNEETAQDNEFQNRVNLTEAEVKLETMAEFKAMVASLRKEGVQVVEFDYPELGVETPDAVFLITGLAPVATEAYLPSLWRVKTVKMK